MDAHLKIIEHKLCIIYFVGKNKLNQINKHIQNTLALTGRQIIGQLDSFNYLQQLIQVSINKKSFCLHLKLL